MSGPSPPPTADAATGPLDILLLMKSPEAAFCAAALRRVNARLAIARASSVEEIEAAVPKLARPARLIAFSTAVVVPGRLLPPFTGGAFNFHPGPPEYPGNRPSAFASYDGVAQFGVTFHRMIAKVDAGEILDCERFPTAGKPTAGALAIEAYQRLARLFLRNATILAQPGMPIPANGEVWSGRKTSMADYEEMCRVPRGTDPAELSRRLRAFSGVYTPVQSKLNPDRH